MCQKPKSRYVIHHFIARGYPAKAKESEARGYQTRKLCEHTKSRTLLVVRHEGQYDLVVGVGASPGTV